MRNIYIILITALVFAACTGREQGRERNDFTTGWYFFSGDLPDAHLPGYDHSSWRSLTLPHDWSIEADFSELNPATPGGGALPGGVGWYRKTFTVPAEDKGKNIYIDFDGIYMNSSVWINGHLLGERPNGYVSFRYDLTPYLQYGGENVLAVKVDNSMQPNSRWYTGSGIYRNVWLTVVNPLHVDLWGTYVTTPVVSWERAEIAVQTTLRNNYPDLQKAVLHTLLLDSRGNRVAEVQNDIEILSDSLLVIRQTLSLDNPVLWSVEDPYLYTVVTQIKQAGKLMDEYRTSTGIRWFEFDAAKGFFLNGKPVKIKGVCNHHDLGCLGAAVNVRAMERQLEILREMGCNGIRTAHNPPAPELLDLCDKMGFIVMDEAFDVWRKRKTPYDYSHYFPEWHERDLTDVILRDRNHPSIFMWSVGNEVLEQWSDIHADTLDMQQANMVLNFANTLTDFDQEGLHINSLLAAKLAGMVKELDPTRPVTSGNNETEPRNHIFRSGAMDIIGFNYHEYNYAGFPDKYPGEKLILTETTSGLMSRGYYIMPSDSIYLWPERWDKPFDRPVHHCSSYDNNHVPWGSTHEKTWDLVKKHDHISGMYLWTGFDYLGEPTPFWWPSRSSYFGIIDLAGFPKDVYYMYQSEWAEKEVLHLFPHWNWKEGDIVDIWAYYNQADEVELFLNGSSLGRKSKPENTYHVSWRVPFEKGALKAVSYRNNTPVMTREIRTTGQPASIRLTADRSELQADGRDLSFITVEVMDKEGNVVPDAKDLIRFSVSGEGSIVGTDNGDPTDSVSLKKPERHLFSGKALVVVQATDRKGKITLKASAEGLPDETIEIKSAY